MPSAMSTDGKIAAVIFDMDGVIIDSEPLHYESTIRYLNDELGLAYDHEENMEFLGRSDEYMFRVLRKRYNLAATVHEMIERRRDLYLKLLIGHVTLNPGTQVLIRRLHRDGFQLAVASSSLERIIDVVLSEGGVKQYFDVVQSGEHLTNCKPHPEIFLITAERLGIPPGRCVVIEDTSVGIQAAKAAGMRAIAYDAPGAPAQDFEMADAVIASFVNVDLPQVFDQ